MSSENPYAAPLPSEQTERSQPRVEDQEKSLAAIAKRTFVHWEKLRLIYVGILVLFTLIVGALFGVILNPEFWISSIFGAIFCNLCYFAGPIIDTYFSWLGFKTKPLRWFLIVAGTLFTACLAYRLNMVIAISS